MTATLSKPLVGFQVTFVSSAARFLWRSAFCPAKTSLWGQGFSVPGRFALWLRTL